MKKIMKLLKKKKKKYITIDNADFTKKSKLINSPRTLEACLHLGVEPKELYKLNVNEFKKKYPEVKKLDKELFQLRYDAEEKFRNDTIEQVKKERQEIIESENKKKEEEENKKKEEEKKRMKGMKIMKMIKKKKNQKKKKKMMRRKDGKR